MYFTNHASVGYVVVMHSAVLNWLWAGLPALLVGALMFAVRTDPDKAEENVGKWWLRVNRARKWLSARWWVSPLSIVLLIGGGVITGIIFAPFLSEYQTDTKFQAASDAVPNLGSPVGASGPSIVYQEAHEHALVVWVASLGTHFVLWPDQTVTRQLDTDWVASGWSDDKATQERLKLVPSCLPPRGGAARDWSNDPDKWKDMGCRTWYCGTVADAQEFKGGIVFGPVAYEPSNSEMPPEHSRIIVIFGDKWSSKPSAFKAAKCPANS